MRKNGAIERLGHCELSNDQMAQSPNHSMSLERRRAADAKSLNDGIADERFPFQTVLEKPFLASWSENGRHWRFPQYPRLAFTSTAIQTRVSSHRGPQQAPLLRLLG